MPHKLMPHITGLPKPSRIYIAGPGAVGITLATRIAISGFEVTVVARGESFDKIKASGMVRLLDSKGDHKAAVRVTRGSDLSGEDVIFLCSKAKDLKSLASTVMHAVNAHIVVVPGQRHSMVVFSGV